MVLVLERQVPGVPFLTPLHVLANLVNFESEGLNLLHLN